MKNRSLVIVYIFVLFSCTHTKSEFSHTIKLTDVSNEITMEELFEDFEYISLETTDESIFGRIDKLTVYENNYYILDNMVKKIFVFRQDGKFIRTIGSKGQGPGEYSHLEDFTIDEVNKQIIILGFPSIIYVYDLDGNFIRQKQLTPSPTWKICSHNGELFCSNNHQSFDENEPLIYIFDNEFNLKSKMGEAIFGNALNPFISHPFFKYGENLAYFDNINSSIHFINPDTLSIKFILDNPIPFEVMADVQNFFTNQQNYSFFMEAFLADNILWTLFVNKGKAFVFIMDFTTKKQFMAKCNSYYPTIMSSADGYFYSTASVQELTDDSPIIDPAKVKMTTNYPIEDDSNTLIFRFKPKSIFQ